MSRLVLWHGTAINDPLAVDMKKTEGREIIFKLVKEADIVLENFRPGVMERLGYGYQDLKRINPKIIYCSASGWGSDGPYLKRPGQDLLVQSISGAIMTSGKKSDGPVSLGTALCDQVNALNCVCHTCRVILSREERQGTGNKNQSSFLSNRFPDAGLFYHTQLGRGVRTP